MSTPIITNMAADERMWFVQPTSESLTALLSNPTTWISQNIPGVRQLTKPRYIVQFSTSMPGDGTLRVWGMEETMFIFVGGHESLLNPGGPSAFWTEFEASLAGHLKYGAIEFFVMRHVGRVFIHISLNPDIAYVARMMAHVANDQAAFLQWLQSPTGTVPRVIKEVRPDGSIHDLPGVKLNIVPRGTTNGGPIQPVPLAFQNTTAAEVDPGTQITAMCLPADAVITSDDGTTITAEPEVICTKIYAQEGGPITPAGPV